MKKQNIESIAKKFALENITTGESGEFDLVDLLEYGFKKGVEWADNNPKIGRRWHDICEAPENNSEILIQYEWNSVIQYRTLDIIYERYNDWNDIVSNNYIKAWIYISEIEPKEIEDITETESENEIVDQIPENNSQTKLNKLDIGTSIVFTDETFPWETNKITF